VKVCEVCDGKIENQNYFIHVSDGEKFYLCSVKCMEAWMSGVRNALKQLSKDPLENYKSPDKTLVR